MKTTPWRKSSRSGGQGQCVETRQHDGRCEIRDSKDPAGGVLSFSPEAFAAFVDDVKCGAFDER